jgi:uncharacterized protein YjbI with pentapeptide repeats
VEEEFGFIAFCSYRVVVDLGKECFVADQTHLDVLLQDVEAWNEWREQNPSTRPDLSEADLTGANLSRADLTNAYLSSGTPYIYPYNAANLTGADLTGANLFSVSLFEVNLTGANLTGANLSEANLSGVDLTDVNLKWTSLYGADLSRTTNLTQKQIEEAFGDEQTKLPEHLKRPADWSRSSDEQPNIDE